MKAGQVLLLSLGVSLILTACEKTKLDLPAAYELSGTSLKSLTEVVGADEAKAELSEMETADQSGESDNAADSGICTYDYDKLSSGSTAASAYASYLTNTEMEFVCVDENGKKTTVAPDYTDETGEASFARKDKESNEVLTVHISWSDTECKIVLTSAQTSDGEENVEMTNNDAVSYLKSLSPADLGLTGTSMNEYTIYPMDSIVQVDGMPCLKLRVYQDHPPENSNRLIGTYLFAGDQKHLYKLEVGNEVVELAVS